MFQVEDDEADAALQALKDSSDDAGGSDGTLSDEEAFEVLLSYQEARDKQKTRRLNRGLRSDGHDGRKQKEKVDVRKKRTRCNLAIGAESVPALRL